MITKSTVLRTVLSALASHTSAQSSVARQSPVEFGAKLDMSIDERGIARLEYLCFDAYIECDVLTGAIDRYRERSQCNQCCF